MKLPSSNSVAILLVILLIAGNASQADVTSARSQVEPFMDLSARSLKTCDPSFFISPDFVSQDFKEGRDIFLIDVRGKDLFEKYRIPGSLNIPLYALKTKSFLKQKSLVLVNEGHSCGLLIDECRRLMNSGFSSISVLEGGLNHWAQKGLPLEGDLFARREINRISPQVFFTEKDYDHMVIINASESKQAEAQNLIPRSIPITFSSGTGRFSEDLKTATGKFQDQPFLSILIFDDRGEQYEKMEGLIGGMSNIYYLKGGWEGYKNFLDNQSRILNPGDDSEKTIEQCGSCP